MNSEMGSGSQGIAARARLRAALLEHHAWLTDETVGPAAVEAGECDGCGAEARLVMVCGPGADGFLGARCALARGTAAWCDGHELEASEALERLAALPPRADLLARLWWVATGEVRLDPALVADLRSAAQLPA